MSLTLLPTLKLSTTREIVKIEITCTGRPAEDSRPALSSYNSFSSSASGSSTSQSARKNRPNLSPEALLVHAFGHVALSRLSPPTLPTSSSVSGNSQAGTALPRSNPAPAVRRTSSRPERQHRKGNFDRLPSTPPRGTFRSVAKPTTDSNPCLRSTLSLSELHPFQVQNSLSQIDAVGDSTPRVWDRNLEREPPMSTEVWQEKVESRLQRRMILRLKIPKEERVPLSVEIDSRPLESSIGYVFPKEVPRTGILTSSSRTSSSHTLTDLVHDDMKEEQNKDEDVTRKGNISRRISMVEMQDIADLVKIIHLEDPPG